MKRQYVSSVDQIHVHRSNHFMHANGDRFASPHQLHAHQRDATRQAEWVHAGHLRG
ncbi:hypothetical protein CCP4SC76_3800002 [Gammaproteobacteria bacterium]